ncbi:MAG: GNAT family N-acetyltransferase [Spirochaetales bacterium]|nr:GNAT family N-acetyltransferase [Spirochaetales bacterium]
MEFVWHASMAEIAEEEWNRLATTLPTPLLSHEWLSHLEASGSIAPDSGWTPLHLTAHEEGRMVAAVPLYLHGNSWGEFVFDFAFAEVAGQLGVDYYPKLVGMSPATPSTAFGFLTETGREGELAAPLYAEIERFCVSRNIPVLQFNFVIPEWRDRFEHLGMVAWEHHGYTWYNEDFSTFDEYLARFRKNQRRNIRRERATMAEFGIDIRMVHAAEAPQHYFERMADYYIRTNAQFGPYAARFLSREFFTVMPESVRRHVWFVAACNDADDPLALAFIVRKGEVMLGRYWGTQRDVHNLHFNVCYYAPIEWAIREGVRVFDPGMGSEHKVRRGFRSVPTFSMHRCFDRHMQAILEANMDRINSYERAQIRMLDAAIPFKE